MNEPYQVVGVTESATDEQIKRAYRELARKYHPDNYHDNPLADLAQEKMKEINAAYEEITKRRSGGNRAGGSSYGSYGGYQQQTTYGGSAVVFQQVRIAIQTGNLERADALLTNYGDHCAEWNFLKGAVCYRRGWMDEARRYYETACQMEPGNQEYQDALDYMENGPRSPYHPNNGSYGTLCAPNPCWTWCCLSICCNGGWCFFI